VDTVEHDPSRRDRVGTWAVESREAALARAPEFGLRFFRAIFDEFAETAGARFLRWSEQPGDIYAVFDLPEGGAGVQVDPDLEYIIVWGVDGQAEYGDWGSDQVPPAVDHIRRLMRRDRGETEGVLPRL
jgi:hypothetical protein